MSGSATTRLCHNSLDAMALPWNFERSTFGDRLFLSAKYSQLPPSHKSKDLANRLAVDMVALSVRCLVYVNHYG